jgi:hypothetical protein
MDDRGAYDESRSSQVKQRIRGRLPKNVHRINPKDDMHNDACNGYNRISISKKMP